MSSRSPRATCWARQPDSIASNIASSGRSCTTPETSSRRAAPARSARPTRPPSNRNGNHLRPGSCIQRARLAITAGHTGLTCRSAYDIGTARRTAKPGKRRPSDAIPESSGTHRRTLGRSPARNRGIVTISKSVMADDIRVGVEDLPDERDGPLGAEVHRVAGASLHLVKRRDRRALSRTARAAADCRHGRWRCSRHA